jgi:hypothetical protein
MVDSAAAWLPETRAHLPIKPVKDAGRSPYLMYGQARGRSRTTPGGPMSEAGCRAGRRPAPALAPIIRIHPDSSGTLVVESTS